MNLKTSIAAVVLGLVAGVGCSSSSSSPKPAAGVVESTTQPSAQTVSFSSCADALAAGYHDMTRGAPGYSARLDGDGDGVACDQKPKAASTTTTMAKPELRVGDMTKAECDAYAAKQSGLNPSSKPWTARMDGTDCVVTPG
jgi:hypothetical protein